MSGQEIRSNHPVGRQPVDKVRELQRRLCAVAKRQPGRRFHALYDRIHRRDVLREAWNRVRSKGGAAGVDALTLSQIESYGVPLFLEELHVELREGKYRPKVVLRRYIPKADGRKRPLGIPTVRDRVVQQAAKLILEPIFEADFKPCSHGFRPRRSATDALEVLRKRAYRDHEGNYVLDADIRDYFGSIRQDLLMERVKLRVSDRRVLKLLRQWLEAGVMEAGVVRDTPLGTPQGGVISPLLANIYLHVLDERWLRDHTHLGTLVRYADDFVVMCDSASACAEAERRIEEILEELGLEFHPEKTRKVELTGGKEGFDFLGCHLRKRLSGTYLEKYGRRRYFLHRWPMPRNMKRVKERVKERTGAKRNGVRDVRVLIRELNPTLRGWGGYFRTGNAAKKFGQVDDYVVWRLQRFMKRRIGRNLHAKKKYPWTREFFENLGLCRLRGTIKYPEAA